MINAYGLKNILVHALVAKRLQVLPIECRLSGSGTTAKDD